MHLDFEVTGINLVHGSPWEASFLQGIIAQNGNRFGHLPVVSDLRPAPQELFAMNLNLTSPHSPAIIA